MDHLIDSHIEFINAQPMFFVATALATGRVNVSPKGLDSLRVIDSQRVVWLSLTGSGNETATHVAMNGQMTLMFMSMTDRPLILRLYGQATVVHPRDERWSNLARLFPTYASTRQIFDMSIEQVAASCGSGVPIMDLVAVRGDKDLDPFYAAMTTDELDDYWQQKNTISIDGHPTGMNP